MPTRITLQTVNQWIIEWNEGHTELPLSIRAYNGYYHIHREDTGDRICADSTPRKTWELFQIWQNGYYTACNMFTSGKMVVLKAKGEIKR